MNIHLMLGISMVLNMVLAAVCWRWWGWRCYTHSMLQSLLQQIRRNSGAIRELELEPWRDELLDKAKDCVDQQFDIVFRYLYQRDVVDFRLDGDSTPDPQIIPREPGSDRPSPSHHQNRQSPHR